MVRELASTEAAYRSITLSWFRHSSVKDLFKALAESNYKIIVTTDHGTIRVDNPIKVVGDRSTNTNLRYKLGKNLDYNPKHAVYSLLTTPDKLSVDVINKYLEIKSRHLI